MKCTQCGNEMDFLPLGKPTIYEYWCDTCNKGVLFKSKTPLSDEATSAWQEFTKMVERRLIIGKETYGDSSFKKPELYILNAIEEELLDVMGWSYILWTKIKKLEALIRYVRDTTT